MGFFGKAKKISSPRRTGWSLFGGFSSKSGRKVDGGFFAYIEDVNKPKSSTRYKPPKKSKPRPQRRNKR